MIIKRMRILKLMFIFIRFREVFKAKDKTNPKKFVAMKKILMETQREGVS